MNALRIILALTFAASLCFAETPVEPANVGNTLVYRADTPQGQWNGWGHSSPVKADADKTPAPGPEQFTVVEATPNVRRTFSGKGAGLSSLDGVEVGLVSLVGVHWVNKEAYQWEKVAADGTFSITDTHYTDAGKAIVLRGPDTAWTFLRYDFKPNEGGKDIVLNATCSKKITLTASGPDMKDFTKVQVEVFDAYAPSDDHGKSLRRQRHGAFESGDQSSMDVPLPNGEVALFVHHKGCAGFYQIIDTRKADHFHFVLNTAGQLRILALDANGNPKSGVVANWINPAAPLSISNNTTKDNGESLAENLVPGTFHLNVNGFGSYTIDIQGGNVTKVLLQDGKDPEISQSKIAPDDASPAPAPK